MSGINLSAAGRDVGDMWAAIRALQRDLAYTRSARAMSLRSILAGLVAGADSVADAALAAAVLVQGRADDAYDLASNARTRADDAHALAASRARVVSGSASGTSDASGLVTVSHTLGGVPAFAAAVTVGAPELTVALDGLTSSTVTFLLVDRATGVAPSTSYSIRWTVIA